MEFVGKNVGLRDADASPNRSGPRHICKLIERSKMGFAFADRYQAARALAGLGGRRAASALDRADTYRARWAMMLARRVGKIAVQTTDVASCVICRPPSAHYDFLSGGHD
jgi:hypothetical protein